MNTLMPITIAFIYETIFKIACELYRFQKPFVLFLFSAHNVCHVLRNMLRLLKTVCSLCKIIHSFEMICTGKAQD